MIENIKIIPRAANAFNIEVYNGFSEKIAYVLQVHADGNRLSFTAINDEGEIIDVTAVIGFWATEGNQKITTNHFTIELSKILVSKKEEA